MNINKEKLEELTRLHITDAEMTQLSPVVEWTLALNEPDTSQVEPIYNVNILPVIACKFGNTQNSTGPTLNHQEILKSVHELKGGGYLVTQKSVNPEE